MANSIVLFESADGMVSLPVLVDTNRGEVWLNRANLAELFGRDIKTIGKHINNALKEELVDSDNRVVAKFATTASDGKPIKLSITRLTWFLSVGYRVKSQRGVEFRRWATGDFRQKSGRTPRRHRIT